MSYPQRLGSVGIAFHIDVTLQMRTVVSRIHLFNDDLFRHVHNIYMKWKEGKRVLDSGETERECVCERQSVAERGGSVGCKMGRWKKCNGWDKNKIKSIRIHKFQKQL